MDKKVGWIIAAGCVVAGGAAVAVVVKKQLDKMKTLEEELETMPLYKVKSKIANVQEDEDKWTIEIPKKIDITSKMKGYMQNIKDKIGKEEGTI